MTPHSLNKNVLLSLKKGFWASSSNLYTLLCGRDQKEPLSPSEKSSFLFDFLSGNVFKLPHLILCPLPIFLTISCSTKVQVSDMTTIIWKKSPTSFKGPFVPRTFVPQIMSKNIKPKDMIKSNIQLFTNTFVAYLPNVWRLCKLGLGHRGNNSQSFLFAVFIWISTFAFFLLRLARSEWSEIENFIRKLSCY